MSSAELTLGADLYTKAANAGLPTLFTKGGEHTEASDYRSLQLAFKDVQDILIPNKLVKKDEAKNWVPDEDKIFNAPVELQDRIVPYYQTLVMAHENANTALLAEGKREYVNDFQKVHGTTILEIAPETVTRVRGADMQAVVTAGLNLLGATHADPANAAFVKGLDNDGLTSLWNVFENAKYLMPGENPDRKSAIGDQVLRGTPEEQEAVFTQAAALVSNLELPETINAGDKPATYAAVLRNAVVNAKLEEVRADDNTMAPDYFDGDLTRTDSNALYNVFNTGIRVINSAQKDTQPGTVMIASDHIDSFKIALAEFDDLGIANALGSGDFEGAGLNSKSAKKLLDGIEQMRATVTEDPDLENFTGDDGGLLTQEGETIAVGGEHENAFDKDEDEIAQPEDDEDEVEAADDIENDIYGKSDTFVRVNESMFQECDTFAREMLYNGTIENLRRHAGRNETEMQEMYGNQAAFGSFDEAMGSDRVATTPEVTNLVSENMTHQSWNALNPERRAKMNVAKIEDDRGPFRGYKSGAPSVEAKRVVKFINSHMVNEDGTPNLDMRRFLRDASELPIVGASTQQTTAVRAYAQNFVKYEQKEFEDRRDKKREKAGITTFDLDAKALGRFIDVAEASGSKDPARVYMEKDGTAVVTHSDAPKLTAQMSETPKEVTNGKGARPFGGHLDIEQLKAAYQTGAEKVTILISGETPYGVVGKVEEEAQKAKAKPSRKYDDVVLS